MILVHVAAPSSATDDARYQAQVNAILTLPPISAMTPTFNANNATTMADPMIATSSASSPTDTQDRRDQTQLPGSLSAPADMHRRNPRNPHSRSRSQSGSTLQSQSQSRSRSRPDQIGSNPGLQSAMGPEVLAPALLDRPVQTPSQRSLANPKSNSLQSLISVIPDSQPYCQEQGEPRAHLSNFISPQAEANSSADQAKTNMVPARNPVPESLANRDHNHDPDLDLDLPIQNSLDPIFTTQEGPVDSEGISKRRRLNTAPNPSTLPQRPIKSPSPLANNQQHLLHRSLPTKSFLTTTSSTLPPFPIEIHPPPPPISTSPFTTHITQTLSMLTQRLKPERIYSPVQQTRDLDTWERGYWAVPITLDTVEISSSKSWNITFFNRFWAFLSEFIGKDARAGWGVWCIAEKIQEYTHPSPLPSTASTDEYSTQDSNADTSTDRAATISVLLKVYTWGEVVMHVYLLLFLASERRIRGLGAEWRDAAEEVVIRMSG
ncbi:uncharacterized protein N7469_009202 [Penicillium citrinum]|uniref:Uncharacterized protein n=1 Tax=Penicillium citrinum TaxID=5077 RepID=A0A9W9THF2_PENCI|nr:uncharacterized protein N7469_009202 [Penicillium citrinum]KAJ5222962.1 hypothetical protein N7469_009202 [Penicillium citrinum]